MSIWKPASIDEQPEVILTCWSIRELSNGDRHFCGYEPQYLQGRVSSKIIEFDSKRLTGKTKSGRVYLLKGSSGTHPDVEYVWKCWKYINRVEDWKEVEIAYDEQT